MILGNFRQKICFRTENPEKLHYFSRLTDDVEVTRYKHATQTGSSNNTGFLSSNTTRSKSENKPLVKKPVMDSQLMRAMNPDHALATLLIKNHSCDDVLLMGEIT